MNLFFHNGGSTQCDFVRDFSRQHNSTRSIHYQPLSQFIILQLSGLSCRTRANQQHQRIIVFRPSQINAVICVGAQRMGWC